MSQSAILIASLLGLFVLFLAAKGRLATYGAVFFGPANPPPSGSGSSDASSSGSSSSGGSSTLQTALQAAELAAAFA